MISPATDPTTSDQPPKLSSGVSITLPPTPAMNLKYVGLSPFPFQFQSTVLWEREVSRTFRESRNAKTLQEWNKGVKKFLGTWTCQINKLLQNKTQDSALLLCETWPSVKAQHETFPWKFAVSTV